MKTMTVGTLPDWYVESEHDPVLENWKEILEAKYNVQV